MLKMYLTLKFDTFSDKAIASIVGINSGKTDLMHVDSRMKNEAYFVRIQTILSTEMELTENVKTQNGR